MNGLVFTLSYTILIVIGKLSIALILALMLSGSLKLRGFFRSIYFFPAVLSMITVGMIFNYFSMPCFLRLANRSASNGCPGTFSAIKIPPSTVSP
ncbi:hypothetical protein [Paenibacillus cisolokensis]|uniref:hypothetical protein n=1 Tax=Paenibacillus cisolokensis TaxID=1658519 RepID=UPI001BCD973B|nr:hypothetical protein [Paenibacillus cisolokensis]